MLKLKRTVDLLGVACEVGHHLAFGLVKDTNRVILASRCHKIGAVWAEIDTANASLEKQRRVYGISKKAGEKCWSAKRKCG